MIDRRSDSRWNRASLLALLVPLLAASLDGQKSDNAIKYSPAYPRDGAIVLADNNRVTVWEVLREKGKRSAMYELPLDQVSVTLVEGSVRFTRPDNTSRIEQLRVGGVRFESRGTTLQDEGLSDVVSREIVFQLKDYVPPSPVPIVSGMPGMFPRIDTVKLFENDRINVWDQRWIRGRPISDHLHYTDAFAVFLEGGRLATRDFGKAQNPAFPRRAGEVVAGGQLEIPVKDVREIPRKDPQPGGGRMMLPHEEEVVEGTPRAIWVEFKYGK